MESNLEILAFDKQVSRNSMPTAISILKFHAKALIKDYGKFWLDVLFESEIAEHRKERIAEQTKICFACGCDAGTQRAHIVPVCKGGTNELSNLHLLCIECHAESEFIEVKEVYFEWFKFKNPSNSGSYLRVKNKGDFYAKLYKEGKLHLIPDYIKEYLTLCNP